MNTRTGHTVSNTEFVPPKGDSDESKSTTIVKLSITD